MDQMRSAEYLVDAALSTPGVLEELAARPEETLKKLEAQAVKNTSRALEGDKWVYRMVVGALGIVVIAVVFGVIYMTTSQSTPVEVPDVLTALGSAAIGALAGLLAPSPGSRQA
jgi:hypothetical protein